MTNDCNNTTNDCGCNPVETWGCLNKVDLLCSIYTGKKLEPLNITAGMDANTILRIINDYILENLGETGGEISLGSKGNGVLIYKGVSDDFRHLIGTLIEGDGISIEDTQNGIVISAEASTMYRDVTSSVTEGNITAGQVIPIGTDLQTFVELLLLKTFNPTFVQPSLVLSNNAGSKEIGTVLNLNLTNTFNPGSINGKKVNGVWNPSTFQANRAGSVTKHIIDGVVYETSVPTQTKIVNNYKVKANETFTSNISYSQGPQPKNSDGVDYSTPLPAGENVLGTTTTIIGLMRRYAGSVAEFPTTGAELRTMLLANSNIETSNNMTLQTGSINRKFVIAIPANKTLRSVQNTGTNQFFYDSTRTENPMYLSEITQVPDASGDNQPYKVYMLENDARFNSNYTFNIILS